MICNNTANPSLKAQDQIENYADRKLCKIKLKIMQGANHANHARCKSCKVRIMQSVNYAK